MLCSYLGQLSKVKDALKDEMVVIIDKRDQDALDAHDDGEEVDSTMSVERVNVTKRVRLLGSQHELLT